MFRQNFQIFNRNDIFLAQIVHIVDFLVEIRNQSPGIDPYAKCQPNWTKGSRVKTSKDSENCLMTSYTRDNDDVIKTFYAFERLSARVP